jgi:ATP-dependent RNA helicase DDX23/PRP28
VAPPTNAELDTIRARYLGQTDNKKKPRLRKVADKKVIFDWNVGDDTSVTKQSWADDAQGGLGGTMFGGRLAGMDEAGKDKKENGVLQDK